MNNISNEKNKVIRRNIQQLSQLKCFLSQRFNPSQGLCKQIKIAITFDFAIQISSLAQKNHNKEERKFCAVIFHINQNIL